MLVEDLRFYTGIVGNWQQLGVEEETKQTGRGYEAVKCLCGN